MTTCFVHVLFSRCTLRFPSTNVKITFQALHGSADNTATTGSAADSSPSPAKPMQPLHISIPKPSESVSVFASPCPSPTGTIRFELYYHCLFCFLEKKYLHFVLSDVENVMLPLFLFYLLFMFGMWEIV